MKQKIKRLTALVCAAAMMAALCLALRPVDTAYGASLNDQLAETRAKKQEIQQQLDQIKSDKAKALEQKELLDQQAAVIAQQIDLLELQIKDTQDRITENEAQEEQQYQLFCRQVRQEEERGAVSYWSVLFKATGFADLLSRMDFINEIVEHDQSSCAPCASSWPRIRRIWSSSRRSLPPARQSWTPRWPRLPGCLRSTPPARQASRPC
jgi:peptidoglycan hydrolase CwlO-like protein